MVSVVVSVAARKKGLPRPADQFSKFVFYVLTEWAMGLEPTTSSLGSGMKTRGAMRSALRINGIRPAYFTRG